MIKQEKSIDPLKDLDEEKEFWSERLPVIINRQINYIIAFLLPKLGLLDRIVMSKIVWFSKKRWRGNLFRWWFKNRVVFIPFEGIQEPFLTIDKIKVYGNLYEINLPLDTFNGPNMVVKDKIEDLEVVDGVYKLINVDISIY